jgi:hypothetical protein
VSPLKRCWDLTEAHISDALGTRAAMGQLLRDLAAVARPNDGGPKILLALARIADPQCDWREGTVRVELERAGDGTRIAVMEDLGGVRELLFPRLLLNVPFAELERSVRVAPRAIEPLQLQKTDDKIVLTQRKTHPSRSLPAIELADDCVRRTQPPGAESAPPAPPARPSVSGARPVPPPLPTKARPRSRPPAPPPPKEMGFEMPRASKVLDFGDFDRAARKTSPAEASGAKKRPSRIPPDRR